MHMHHFYLASEAARYPDPDLGIQFCDGWNAQECCVSYRFGPNGILFTPRSLTSRWSSRADIQRSDNSQTAPSLQTSRSVSALGIMRNIRDKFNANIQPMDIDSMVTHILAHYY